MQAESLVHVQICCYCKYQFWGSVAVHLGLQMSKSMEYVCGVLSCF